MLLIDPTILLVAVALKTNTLFVARSVAKSPKIQDVKKVSLAAIG